MHVLSVLYRRVSTRVRVGVWAPDGRSTLARPQLVADPLGGSAKPQYGISKNLTMCETEAEKKVSVMMDRREETAG